MSFPKEHFLQLLQETVDRKGNSTFATWYDKHGKPELKYTFNELWNEAGYITHDLLANHHLSKGDRVILCYNFGLQFFAAFLACLRAGVVAVLIYPPLPSNMTKSLEKMNKVVDDSKPKLILIDGTINLLRINPLSKTRHLWPKDVTWKVHPKIPKNMKNSRTEMIDVNLKRTSNWDGASIVPEDIAFLQYTSGSTGDPKGVMVSFRALHANVKFIHNGIQNQMMKKGIMPYEIVGFSWLPQYHDMGLIQAVIAPFAGGWKCNMISPVSFIQNPLLWIDLMSKLRVNWTVAPNFAFRLAARKFLEAKKKKAEPIQNLNLQHLQSAQNAAEPIQTDTKDMFEQAFKEYGLNDDWFVTAYGLAESVVGVCHLCEYKVSTYTPNGSTPLIAVGHKNSFPKQQIIKIIDTKSFKEVQEKEVGELWLSGPSVASGYFGKPQLTQEVFHAKLNNNDERQYLRTGDLAFMEDGYLYICGRLKDIVIVNGVNYYPQDIEHAVENASPGVRPGCVAAFSSDDIGADGDLEIVFEVRKSHESSANEVATKVYDEVLKYIGIVPSKVVAIKERTICKTTSGKIQRKATRAAFHSGHFDIIYIHTGHTPLKKRMTTHTATSSSIESDSNSEEDNTDDFDRIIYSYFGPDLDFEQSWDDLGMSSMMSIQLCDAISDAFPVALPPDAFELYPSPADLKAFVNGTLGEPITVHLNEIPEIQSSKISWFWLGVLQLLGGFGLLLLFSFCVIPSFYIGKLLVQLGLIVEIPTSKSTFKIDWIWIPIIIPVWMFSFSLCVALIKWIFIGRYKEGIVQVQSIAYVQWWLVDRAVALWEAWIGKFFLDTPLLNAFYFVMGAKINMHTSVNSFIREFDLVTVEGFSSVSHPISCRKFGAWTDEGPSLRFRSVLIGNACEIKGMVSPGCSIGDGSYVDSLSVIPEGGQVPELSKVVGNPAFITGKACPYESKVNQSVFGFLKVMWLVFELYLFFSTILLGQYLWVPYLPQWRYSSLLLWFLLILWFAYASIGTSVLLKWILVGKRRPGKTRISSLSKEMCHWAADWHFVNAFELISITAYSGTIWNVILKLHGMDIDMATRLVAPLHLMPSKVDLVSIKESFVSNTIFDVEYNGCLNQVVIEKSSIGYGCRASTSIGNLQVTKVSIPPYSKIIDTIHGNDDRVTDFGTMPQKLWIGTKLAFLHIVVVLGGSFCSLIPSYELWILCWQSKSIWIAVPLLTISLIVHTISLALILSFLQLSALKTEKNSSETSYRLMHMSFLRVACVFKFFSVPVVALCGSSLYNGILNLLGVRFEGQAIVMDQALYEYKNVSVQDKTIVDSAHVSGHHAVFDRMTLGHSSLAGILHQGTYVSCGIISGPETDPWRTYIGGQAPEISEQPTTVKGSATIIGENSYSFDDEDKRLSNSSDIESPIIAEASDDAFEVNPISDDRTNTSGHDDCISYSSSDISC